MSTAKDSNWIVAKAHELGFDLCGITATDGLVDTHLKEWLERGYAGQMGYLHDSRRAEVTQVLPNAKSIIVCAMNYNAAAPPSVAAAPPRTGWIARYAWSGRARAHRGLP